MDDCERMLTMNIKPNIGIINSLMRMTCGLTMLAWATSKMAKCRNGNGGYLIISMLAAMKVAEGILRFCPITMLYKEQAEPLMDQMTED